MPKLHARVTKEIEITYEQAERLIHDLCRGSTGTKNISDIINMFNDDVDSGYYENGYIPGPWLEEDIQSFPEELRKYFEENNPRWDCVDIEL